MNCSRLIGTPLGTRKLVGKLDVVLQPRILRQANSGGEIRPPMGCAAEILDGAFVTHGVGNLHMVAVQRKKHGTAGVQALDDASVPRRFDQVPAFEGIAHAEQHASFGKVAVAAVVGNEDGAHHCHAEIFQALNDVGFTIPAGAGTYWMGEAMGSVDYKDLKRRKRCARWVERVTSREAASERPLFGI